MGAIRAVSLQIIKASCTQANRLSTYKKFSMQKLNLAHKFVKDIMISMNWSALKSQVPNNIRLAASTVTNQKDMGHFCFIVQFAQHRT